MIGFVHVTVFLVFNELPLFKNAESEIINIYAESHEVYYYYYYYYYLLRKRKHDVYYSLFITCVYKL